MLRTSSQSSPTRGEEANYPNISSGMYLVAQENNRPMTFQEADSIPGTQSASCHQEGRNWLPSPSGRGAGGEGNVRSPHAGLDVQTSPPQQPLSPANESQPGSGVGRNLAPDSHWGQLPSRRGIERRSPTPPTTRVNIGRIEVRPAPPPEPPAAPAKSPRRAPGLSLEGYLKQRHGAQS